VIPQFHLNPVTAGEAGGRSGRRFNVVIDALDEAADVPQAE
jgi:hypothetical protein